jgi:hypothetical protein
MSPYFFPFTLHSQLITHRKAIDEEGIGDIPASQQSAGILQMIDQLEKITDKLLEGQVFLLLFSNVIVFCKEN